MSWAIITHIDSGPIASRPAANAVPGRHYGWWATDTKVLSISDGTTWTDIGPGGGSGVTFGTPAVVLGTSAAAGSTDEVIRRDSTIVAFDATAPTTQAFGDAAAVGTAAVAARRDHKHAMPATPTSVSGNAGTATALQTGRTIDGQTFDGTANITVIAPGTHAATGKTTPVDADELPLVDSAASNVLKKLTWANVKATLKTYFDTLYAATGSVVTSINKTGSTALTGAVTLTGGTNVTLTQSGQDISIAASGGGSPSLTYSQASLSGDVTTTTANTYYDGPSVTLGAGTWLVMAYLSHTHPSGGTAHGKLWDGTTVAASSEKSYGSAGSSENMQTMAVIVLSGSATIKMSMAHNINGGAIRAAGTTNTSGNSASRIVAVQIA